MPSKCSQERSRFSRWLRLRLLRVVALSLTYSALALNTSPQVLPTRAPKPIKEEMFVRIGGIDQWITIKGADRNNPVVLFLHGGPGDAWSPFADALFGGWEKEFTLVQWDQRGAGRTYGKSGPSIEPTMTIERMAQDGIEVAEFLTKHLNKKQIIIEGASWGSILGINMAHARPDLFYAYVGVAQLAGDNDINGNWSAALELDLKMAIVQKIGTSVSGQVGDCAPALFHY
jgi:pimeloyl-ACP methyl ester carboxylesterase